MVTWQKKKNKNIADKGQGSLGSDLLVLFGSHFFFYIFMFFPEDVKTRLTKKLEKLRDKETYYNPTIYQDCN